MHSDEAVKGNQWSLDIDQIWIESYRELFEFKPFGLGGAFLL